jgi:hypothetical protein
MASETKTQREIEEMADAWIRASYRDPDGVFSRWEGRYDANNMEEAYCAGYAAAKAEPALRIAELEEVLVDLLSWFEGKPSDPEWRIKAGAYGADDAIQAARSAIAKATS